jgi:ribosomal-protein-alanine acetyltransferase
VIIRPATASDIPAILDIERHAQSAAHWTEAAYGAIFASDAPTRIVLVAQGAAGQLCGFVVARAVADECELENIVVALNDTRQGIGSALLRELIRTARAQKLRRIFLEVRDSNHAARHLYEKMGFREDMRRKTYYSDPPEDAILYSLAL